MGFRTVVMLSNDEAHKWSHDPELGRLIFKAASAWFDEGDSSVANYGRVVECLHADMQTLVVMDGYDVSKMLAHSSCRSHQEPEDVALGLLKSAAEKMGYKLVKKPAKREG